MVIVDNLPSGKKGNLNPKAVFYRVDIGDAGIAEVFSKEKPDVVFHSAAHIEARESVKDSLFDARVNILGTLNILENCRKFKVKKILFASSGGEVYGSAKKIPTPETYAPRPISPYGVAKLAVEKYLDSYAQLFGLPYLALRYGNVYGPRQNPKGEAGVVAIFTDKMLHGESVFIHGSGKQTKDYIFIDDAIDATMLAFTKDISGVLNIATGKETSVLEIFRSLQKLIGSRVKEDYISPPLGGFPRGCLSIAKAKKELHWQPKTSMSKGLVITVEWFRKHHD